MRQPPLHFLEQSTKRFRREINSFQLYTVCVLLSKNSFFYSHKPLAIDSVSSTQVLFLLSYIGGLVCFSLRYNEVDHYEPKMTELEKEGIWEKLGSKKIPYFNQEDMPSYAYGFGYKVLKK